MPIQFPDTSGTDLVDDIAAMIVQKGDNSGSMRDTFLEAIIMRMKDIESR